MSNSVMEQYFENLQREKNQALWKKTSEDIGRQEPEVATLPPEADQTDQTDQADPDNGKAYFEKLQWHEFSQQVGDAFHIQRH